MEPEYIDIPTANSYLRVTFEISVGDLVVGSLLALVLFFLILDLIRKIVWGR